MNNLADQIARFRNMAPGRPGQRSGALPASVSSSWTTLSTKRPPKSFRRTLELTPEFSKVFQLLGECLNKLDRKDEAV